MMTFKDQVVVVTGASRGIGKTIAIEFAKFGAKVACIATNNANVESTVDQIKANGGISHGFGCNISQKNEVEKCFQSIIETMGIPSVLVNNAGITKDNLLVRMQESEWDDVLNINLKGTYHCIQALTRSMMKARYGRIVNLSSIVGVQGAAGQANYAASKAGICGLSKSIAKELGGRGITCNVVAPGFIETDMTSNLPESMREEVIKNAPIARLGQAIDVAHAVLFLATKEAGYITGQTLLVDGGLSL